MLDCIKLTTKLNDIAKANIELDQAIDRYVSSDQNAIVKQKTELLMDIYRARKSVKDKIQNIRDRIKAEEFLESLPEDRVERVTAKLGTFKTPVQLTEALDRQDIFVVDTAKKLLGDARFTLTPTEKSEDLVILSTVDIMGLGSFKLEEIYDKSSKLGFRLCLPETAPQLSLQYSGMKKFSIIFFAMESLSDGIFGIFSLENGDNKLEICANLGQPQHRYSECRFVFRLP